MLHVHTSFWTWIYVYWYTTYIYRKTTHLHPRHFECAYKLKCRSHYKKMSMHQLCATHICILGKFWKMAKSIQREANKLPESFSHHISTSSDPNWCICIYVCSGVWIFVISSQTFDSWKLFPRKFEPMRYSYHQHIFVNMYMYTYVLKCLYMCIHICLYICTFIHIHTYKNMYKYIYMYMNIYICINMQIHIYIYTCIWLYILIHIHI